MSKTPVIPFGFIAPVIAGPSTFWQLSATPDGIISATSVAPTSAPSTFQLSSVNGLSFSLSILDSGILMTTSQGVVPPIVIPYPTNVTMSVFPNLGIQSTLAGATPLTVSADFSIWSCTLNRFINEDTTNIIVVLSE